MAAFSLSFGARSPFDSAHGAPPQSTELVLFRGTE
jgi:hypothetical protein